MNRIFAEGCPCSTFTIVLIHSGLHYCLCIVTNDKIEHASLLYKLDSYYSFFVTRVLCVVLDSNSLQEDWGLTGFHS